MVPSNTMLAIGCREFGGPEQAVVLERPMPKIGPRQILVEVAFATLNPADLSLRAGQSRVVTGPPPYVGGLEFAGSVSAAGPDSIWSPGDRVAGFTSFIPPAIGAHSQFVAIGDNSAARVPDNMSLEDAAVIPMSGLTAQLAVDRAVLLSGGSEVPTTVAISGAGGAVGAFAVELAVEAGLRVVAVVRESYVDRARAMGATDVVIGGIDAVRQIWELVPGGVDALIDGTGIGAAPFDAIRDGGALITLRPLDHEFRRSITVQNISVREYGSERGKLHRLIQLAANGQLTPRVSNKFSPYEAAKAHRLMEAGSVGGRIVFDFTQLRSAIPNRL